MGLDSVEWVMEIESEFGVSVPDEVAETFHTPRDAVEWLVRQVDKDEWPRERVESRVLEISAETFRVKIKKVRLDSHIVDDLGAD